MERLVREQGTGMEEEDEADGDCVAPTNSPVAPALGSSDPMTHCSASDLLSTQLISHLPTPLSHDSHPFRTTDVPARLSFLSHYPTVSFSESELCSNTGCKWKITFRS